MYPELKAMPEIVIIQTQMSGTNLLGSKSSFLYLCDRDRCVIYVVSSQGRNCSVV